MQFDTSWRPVARLREGELMLPFHGIAFEDHYRYTRTTAVVPLNWAIAIGRVLWANLRVGTVKVALDPRAAYLQGLRRGRR